jgi:hypothetical protein
VDYYTFGVRLSLYSMPISAHQQTPAYAPHPRFLRCIRSQRGALLAVMPVLLLLRASSDRAAHQSRASLKASSTPFLGHRSRIQPALCCAGCVQHGSILILRRTGIRVFAAICGRRSLSCGVNNVMELTG